MLGTIFGSHLPLVEFGDLEINGWRYCTLSKKKAHLYAEAGKLIPKQRKFVNTCFIQAPV